MGELFDRERPATALEWTGERLTSDAVGQVEMEHLHRYFMARELCRGLDVLDIAAGEGYGSSLLAQTARSVVAVELDESTVAHASLVYRRTNLTFRQGDARSIDLPDASVDCVVSYETIEHFFEQEKFCSEVRRVLRPSGIFIVSSPDRDVYSPLNGPSNPYHVRELKRDEFIALLSRYFPSVHILGQRAMVGSVIFADENRPVSAPIMTFERRKGDRFEASAGLSRSQYLIAVCSNEAAARPINSIYCEQADIDGVMSLPSVINALQQESLRVAAAEAYAQAQVNMTVKAQDSELLARDKMTAQAAELESSIATNAELRHSIHDLECERLSLREARQLDQDQLKRNTAVFEEEVSHLRGTIVTTVARHRDEMLSSRDAYEAERARLCENLSRQSDALQETEQALSAARYERQREMDNLTAAHDASFAELRQAHDALAIQMASKLKTSEDRRAAADAETSSRRKPLADVTERLDQSAHEIDRLSAELDRVNGERLHMDQRNAKVMEENKPLRRTPFGYAGNILMRLFRSA